MEVEAQIWQVTGRISQLIKTTRIMSASTVCQLKQTLESHTPTGSRTLLNGDNICGRQCSEYFWVPCNLNRYSSTLTATQHKLALLHEASNSKSLEKYPHKYTPTNMNELYHLRRAIIC